MREDFLHHIWKYGLFNKNDLQTRDGRPVTIVNSGAHNHHAGPDFFNAKVIIGETTWVGNVEIHVNESDWNRHGHQHDEAYNNVVLHVVYQADGESLNAMKQEIPVVELLARVSRKQHDLYQSFLNSSLYIPCENRLPEVDQFLVATWLERVLIERLERKSTDVLNRLQRNTGDWKQTLFEQLAMSFGFKINAQPMEMLARSIPVKLLAKYQHSLTLIEALLFGQAGMLDDHFSDEYPRVLQNEYAFLRKKHQLVPINPVVWKYGRMRPYNFPTIRIAQLAALVHKSKSLFSVIIDRPEPKAMHQLFAVSATDYWNTNHRFDAKTARSSDKKIGQGSRDNLLINTVVPFLFAYSKHVDSAIHLDTALELLESIAAEKNSVVDKMEDIGFEAGNAARSQALLELKSQYCDPKKCLNCAIGGQLIKSV